MELEFNLESLNNKMELFHGVSSSESQGGTPMVEYSPKARVVKKGPVLVHRYSLELQGH